MLIMIILFLKVSHVLVERVGDACHHGHPQPDQALSCFQGLSIIMVNMVVVVVVLLVMMMLVTIVNLRKDLEKPKDNSYCKYQRCMHIHYLKSRVGKGSIWQRLITLAFANIVHQSNQKWKFN